MIILIYILQRLPYDALLCVRYRTDEKRGLRLKTVELIVGEKPLRTGSKYQDEEMVNLIVAYGETILRDQLKSLGRWNPKEKLWQVEFGAIRGIPELVERIVQPETWAVIYLVVTTLN